MNAKTSGGTEYDYMEPDEMPEAPAFVVMVISGADSDVGWIVKAVAASRADAEAWIDANPLGEPIGWYPDNYEVQVGAQAASAAVAPAAREPDEPAIRHTKLGASDTPVPFKEDEWVCESCGRRTFAIDRCGWCGVSSAARTEETK